MKKISTLFLVITALLMLPMTTGAQNVTEFDFLDNNMNLPVGTANDVNAGNLGGKTIVQGYVNLSLVNSATMPTRYYLNANKNQLQVIGGGQLRFTAADGKAVTKIEITPVANTNPVQLS